MMNRVLGDYGAKDAEKLFVCIGSLHGNEPSGWKALTHIFKELEAREIPIKGRFVGITGNIAALKEQVRLIDFDLNRLWSENYMEQAHQFPNEKAEYRELKGICEVFDQINFDQYEEKYFLDLHTTSAENGIFLIVKNMERVGYIANHLGVPVLLGLDNQLQDTTVPYMTRHGFTALGFESGQHDSPQSVENHITVIWRLLLLTEMLEEQDVPASFLVNASLEAFTNSIPSHLNVEYRHAVSAEDHFKMLPGFKNFDPIEKGQLLAHDKNGEIRANQAGYILMPLYQKEGKDGFFLTSDVAHLAAVASEKTVHVNA